jgi:flavin-binding protein dodecin
MTAPKTYTIIELVGVSEVSESEAVRSAIKRAAQTLQGLDWFEVVDVRGTIGDGGVAQFQVKLKVGFRLMTEAELKGS